MSVGVWQSTIISLMIGLSRSYTHDMNRSKIGIWASRGYAVGKAVRILESAWPPVYDEEKNRVTERR